jgi:hypothetical protein
LELLAAGEMSAGKRAISDDFVVSCAEISK